jgi:hypothetical protein
MTIKDLIPWNRGRSVPLARDEDMHPFLAMHREMNRMFDDVFSRLRPYTAQHRSPPRRTRLAKH